MARRRPMLDENLVENVAEAHAAAQRSGTTQSVA
jgi:hypothetical protein